MAKIKIKPAQTSSPAKRKAISAQVMRAQTPTKPQMEITEDAHVDEFSGKAAVGIISAGAAAALYLIFAIINFATLGVAGAIVNISLGLFMAICCFLMLKKSRVAAMMAFTTYLLFFGGTIIALIWGGGFGFSVLLVAKTAILVGLWGGVEGITAYHVHQKEHKAEGRTDLLTQEDVAEVFE